MVKKLKINNGRYNMALLDFMKEGFNTLKSQPQMYDPHENARRLMGGPVQEQQGGGTGFNFFGGNNYSQNAQEPLPQMDVTGQVGGPSMTPYQNQEVGPSHLGVTNVDRTTNTSRDLPVGGAYNQYYGANEQVWNPETLSYDPAIRGARKDIYSNPVASYTAEQMPNSMQSDGSVAQVDMESLYKQPLPQTLGLNEVWSEELQRYIPITENNAVQQPTGYNPNADINTSMYPTNLLGTGNELVGPTQPNGGGATVADNNAEVEAAEAKKQREASNAETDAARLYPEYIDRSGMSMAGDDYKVSDYDKRGYGENSINYRNGDYQGSGSGPDFNQFDKTNNVVPKLQGANGREFTDYPGEISNFFSGLLKSTGSGTDDTTYAGGEEVKIDYNRNNQSDYNLKRDKDIIINQIMNEDATDEERRQLFEAYGIDPYDYLKEGLISKK
jgi:hypothetical protein